MSEVITGLLKLTFGLVSDKLRTYGAEKLQDGGLTDQKFRGLIVRELDDIKSKLDAISRKDLRTSISCLQEGINRLIMSFDESGNPSTFEIPSAGASSIETKPAQQSVAVEDAVAVANAIGKLKIESNERFELAKESFKEAGKEARRAFHNAALSTEERIVASKVRIASGILQHLNDLELAASDCLHCLQELNDMEAIQEIFSVQVKGGIKSVFKKDSRAEIVQSVIRINLVLADFISKFTKQRMAVFDWPMIKCGKQVVHPIHYDRKSLPTLKEIEITPPWDIVEVVGVVYLSDHGKDSVFNKRGELIFVNINVSLVKLDMTTGKSQPYCISSLDDNNTEQSQPNGISMPLAVDEDDTLYALLCDKVRDEYTLSVHSADGGNTHHCSLEFLKHKDCWKAHINVNKDKNIVICFEDYLFIKVYLCNITGKLINSFDSGLKDHLLRSSYVSCNNEITLMTQTNNYYLKDSCVLRTYAENGQLQRTVKFRPSEGDYVYYKNLFYNQVTKKIMGFVCDYPKTWIECLSDQTAELECSYLLYAGTNLPEGPSFCLLICDSTTGALYLLGEDYIVLLQKPR